jgi:LmbE family N-acetylglucosaminyl deacetylase
MNPERHDTQEVPFLERRRRWKKMPRLLCFTAHPDDEAGGFGGVLQRCASEGGETYVICLTPGQAATHRGTARSDQELSELRRQEFAASCKLLNVSRGEVLDYPDGKLDRQDFLALVDDLTRRVRQIRPHVILAMGPEGGVTAHPDHSMVSIFATLAFHWAGRNNRFPEQLKDGMSAHQAQKLYYATALFTLADRQPTAPAPATLSLELSKQEFETKIAAFKCHTTQEPLFPFFEATMRKRAHLEVFHLAAASAPRKIEVEKDLFAGVKE